MVGDHYNIGTVLKGHGIRKVENHCSSPYPRPCAIKEELQAFNRWQGAAAHDPPWPSVKEFQQSTIPVGTTLLQGDAYGFKMPVA